MGPSCAEATLVAPHKCPAMHSAAPDSGGLVLPAAVLLGVDDLLQQRALSSAPHAIDVGGGLGVRCQWRNSGHLLTKCLKRGNARHAIHRWKEHGEF